VQQLGRVHSRSFWLLTSSFFILFSCMLWIWYFILLLITITFEWPMDYHGRKTLCYLLFIEFTMGVVHFRLAFDLGNSTERIKTISERSEAPESQLRSLFRMYQSKAVDIVKYGSLLKAAKANSEGEAEAKELESTCAVCLEDFASDDSVSQLPCGHIFHPLCAHKWIREDWRCPYRCRLAKSTETNVETLGNNTEAPVRDIEQG